MHTKAVDKGKPFLDSLRFPTVKVLYGHYPENLSPPLETHLGLRKKIKTAKFILSIHHAPLQRNALPGTWGSTLLPNPSQPLSTTLSSLFLFPNL